MNTRHVFPPLPTVPAPVMVVSTSVLQRMNGVFGTSRKDVYTTRSTQSDASQQTYMLNFPGLQQTLSIVIRREAGANNKLTLARGNYTLTFVVNADEPWPTWLCMYNLDAIVPNLRLFALAGNVYSGPNAQQFQQSWGLYQSHPSQISVLSLFDDLLPHAHLCLADFTPEKKPASLRFNQAEGLENNMIAMAIIGSFIKAMQ